MSAKLFVGLVVILVLGIGGWAFVSKEAAPGQAPGKGTPRLVAAVGGAAPSATPAVGSKGDPATAASAGTMRRTATPAPNTPLIEVRRETGTGATLETRETPAPTPERRAPPPRVAAPAQPQGPQKLTISVLEDSGQPEKPSATAPAGARSAAATRKAVALGEPFLPTGEMIKATLVNAVSSNGAAGAETPLIALVTDDKFFNGVLVIPKGTRFHGTAGGLVGPQQSRRLRTGNRWTAVFPQFGDVANGAEMVVGGLALNRAEQARPNSWVLTDGEAGLRGIAIYDPASDKVKQWLATFGAAALATLQSTQTVTSAFGSTNQVSNTPRNAALGGLSAVAAQEVADIQLRIKEDGAFIIVPGGTALYIYLQEAVFPQRARIGGVDRSDQRQPSAPAEENDGLPRVLPPPTPQAIPSAYGRAPNDFTRPAADPASALARPQPTTPR